MVLPITPEVTFSAVGMKGKHSARRRQLGQLEAVLAILGPVLQTGVSSLPTDQAINKTLVNQQEYALFFKMKEISYSIYI